MKRIALTIITAVTILSLLFSMTSCFGAGVGSPKNMKAKLEDFSIGASLEVFERKASIMPVGYDFEKLGQKGYKMDIIVTYDVCYEKDWDLKFGYVGSPRYEVYLETSYGNCESQENLPTYEVPKTQKISTTIRMIDLVNTHLILRFSTNNIQNIIHFSNITIEYNCYK